MKSINISAALEAAQQLEEARTALKGRLEIIGQEVMKFQGEIAALYQAPLNADDTKAFAMNSVDVLAGQFIARAKWADVFRAFAVPHGDRPPLATPVNHASTGKHGHPLCLQDLKAIRDGGENSVANMVGVNFDTTNFFAGAESMGALDGRRAAFFFGDSIKAKIEEYFDRLAPKPHVQTKHRDFASLPIAARREAIAEREQSLHVLHEEGLCVQGQLDELNAAAGSAK